MQCSIVENIGHSLDVEIPKENIQCTLCVCVYVCAIYVRIYIYIYVLWGMTV